MPGLFRALSAGPGRCRGDRSATSGRVANNYFLNTSATWHLAMCSGAFLEKDERDLKIHVSKLGLQGVFKLKLIINDKKYQTGVTICCS